MGELVTEKEKVRTSPCCSFSTSTTSIRLLRVHCAVSRNAAELWVRSRLCVLVAQPMQLMMNRSFVHSSGVIAVSTTVIVLSGKDSSTLF